MMYMVKYGAMAGGLTVPPLLGLNLATEADVEEGHLSFVQKNISRLVDDMITHLEEVIGTIDDDIRTTAYQKLGTLELVQLKSHLRVKDGECFSGDLSKVTSQEGHDTWICKHSLARVS
jgi:hypothetical protein